MARLGELCSSSLALKHLRSLTLAVDDRHNWNEAVLQLLSASPLERFHVSSLGGEVGGDLDEEFCASIVAAHGERLRRFSVHRLRASLESVRVICRRCPNLQQLFIVMDHGDMVGTNATVFPLPISNCSLGSPGPLSLARKWPADGTRQSPDGAGI